MLKHKRPSAQVHSLLSLPNLYSKSYDPNAATVSYVPIYPGTHNTFMSLVVSMHSMARMLTTRGVSSSRVPLRARFHVNAAMAGANVDSFKPMEAVSEELSVVRQAKNSAELAQVDLHEDVVAAINAQINIEYNISYVYHAIHCYFDRDAVSLPGLAAHFLAEAASEREHAQMLIKYLNKRGGTVTLKVRHGVIATE